jgi:ABC-type iron transport system FetAB ATPase subunit
MPSLARVNKLPRRLLRRPRKALLWLTHQTLNCIWNTRKNLRSQICCRDCQEQERILCKGDVPVLGKLLLSADAKYS